MVMARVTSEYYTVATDVGSSACARGETREGRYDSIPGAVEAAMRITLDRQVGCDVLRVTEHEAVTVEDMFGQPVVTSGTVTGKISIPGPRSYDYLPELSRYHPVNGWALPEVVEVKA